MKITNQGIGYFETVFTVIDIETMVEALQFFALTSKVTPQSNKGEILNDFIRALIKTIDYQAFREIAPQFFRYPINNDCTALEVMTFDATRKELAYLQSNIDYLLQLEERGESDGYY